MSFSAVWDWRDNMLGILYYGTNKLSKFCSEPFRGRENNSEFPSVEQEANFWNFVPNLGMATFFREIIETILSLFRGIVFNEIRLLG
jgi:hypothetical protein